MTPKDPFLEETFWDKFWRPIRSRALLFTPDCLVNISVGMVIAPHFSYAFNCRGSRGSSRKGPIYRSWPDLMHT